MRSMARGYLSAALRAARLRRSRVRIDRTAAHPQPGGAAGGQIAPPGAQKKGCRTCRQPLQMISR